MTPKRRPGVLGAPCLHRGLSLTTLARQSGHRSSALTHVLCTEHACPAEAKQADRQSSRGRMRGGSIVGACPLASWSSSQPWRHRQFPLTLPLSTMGVPGLRWGSRILQQKGITVLALFCCSLQNCSRPVEEERFFSEKRWYGRRLGHLSRPTRCAGGLS